MDFSEHRGPELRLEAEALGTLSPMPPGQRGGCGNVVTWSSPHMADSARLPCLRCAP